MHFHNYSCGIFVSNISVEYSQGIYLMNICQEYLLRILLPNISITSLTSMLSCNCDSSMSIAVYLSRILLLQLPLKLSTSALHHLSLRVKVRMAQSAIYHLMAVPLVNPPKPLQLREDRIQMMWTQMSLITYQLFITIKL